MKTAKQVDELITELKASGIPLAEAAWKVALACVGWPYIFGDRGQYCTPAHRRAAYASKGDAHPTIKTKCKNFQGTGSCSGCTFYPVREAPAIERPGLSARVERAPGAAAGPLKVFALRLDGRMISAFRRIRRPPVCRRAVLSAVSEDIRPTNTGQRRLPGSLRQRDPARFQLGDQIRDLLCCFHVHPSRSVSSGTSSSLERLAATRARRKPPTMQPTIIPIRNITIPIGITSKEAGRQADPDGRYKLVAVNLLKDSFKLIYRNSA